MSTMSTVNDDLKRVDARNRFARTLVQNLGYDTAAAVVLVLVTAFNDATGWGDLQWSLMGFTIVKSVFVSLLAYLMRMRSGLLAPPNPQAEPNEDVVIPTTLQDPNF